MPSKRKNFIGKVTGPTAGEFIAPPPVLEQDEPGNALPVQEEFWRPPVRFGSVPVEKEPLGWDRRRGFRKLFPHVSLPFQVVDRITFGHPGADPNRLFWGDNLHVMRQLASESLDLVYIDPPFFSGRQYNVIFGDQNELRSFSDIWEGGMPGYLIWLNARLYEMKRLLKKTGTIYVHCDWHASHYIKAEMDKLFGYENFRSEIIWHYEKWTASSKSLQKNHDVILAYSKSPTWVFNVQKVVTENLAEKHKRGYLIGGGGGSTGLVVYDKNNPKVKELIASGKYKVHYADIEGKPLSDVWRIPFINPVANERIGYPTQKPEALLERLILGSSNEGDLVGDFFSGGGTTAAVAQRLGRRWVACDQSRVAVAITNDRLMRQVEEEIGKVFPVPDYTVEHWGVYEARRLADTPTDQFRQFVLRAFGAVPEATHPGIHGMKAALPVFVGEADPKKAITAREVQDFANAIRTTLRYRQDNLRDGIMLAWAFRPDAVEAAERLRRLEMTDLNFIRLEQIRIDSPRFREHVAALSTEHADYQAFLTFVQAPRVEVGHKRVGRRTYRFDVTDTIISNSGAKIINVQWDFSYRGRFSSTHGFSFIREGKREPAEQVQYEFPSTGMHRIACKVQDDLGGEGMWVADIDVS
jgi:DNA modification methylase